MSTIPPITVTWVLDAQYGDFSYYYAHVNGKRTAWCLALENGKILELNFYPVFGTNRVGVEELIAIGESAKTFVPTNP